MKALQDLEIFVLTSETGSLSAAARRLDLTPAATSAALKRLEAELSAALFVRSTRSLRLTPQGELFLAHCRQALATLAAGRDALAGDGSLHGTLQLSLPSDLGRHRGDGALDELEQCLLHTFARHVTGDRRVVGLAGDFVDLVDVDDALLGLVHLVVALLKQLLDDVFHVLADVAGFGEGRGVRHHEGHVEETGQGLGQQGLAGTGGTDQEDVALGQFDFVVGLAQVTQTLVVVVDRHRQDALGRSLPDHVLIEDCADLLGRRQFALDALGTGIGSNFIADDVVAQLDALVADEHGRSGDQLADLVLALAAERAIQELLAARFLVSHYCPFSLLRRNGVRRSQATSAREVSTLSTRP